MSSDICRETGAYLRNNLQGHFFDIQLANAMSKILKEYEITSVYDFGCGHGEYTRHLRQDGFDCSGFDANPYTEEITKEGCTVLNLSESIDLDPVDCVLCLEMGEHIPRKFEEIVIENIHKSSSNLIVLSWAIEGQDGEGHVNCRNNDYIKKIFQDLGYDNLVGEEAILRNSSSLPWFRNTIMVFKK